MAHGKNFPLNLSIYKPRNKGGGVAVSLSPSFNKRAMYLRFAPQKGTDRRFDWENTIVVKLSENDIGEFMSTFRGWQETVDLFHRSDAGDTTLKLDKVTGEYNGFRLSVTNKPSKDAETRRLSVFLSFGETARFSGAVDLGYQTLLGWSVDADRFNKPQEEPVTTGASEEVF